MATGGSSAEPEPLGTLDMSQAHVQSTQGLGLGACAPAAMYFRKKGIEIR